MIIAVIGPSGSGKTAVGKALAARLAWAFVDADDLHDAAARATMAAGTPLDDADRAPWLARVRDHLMELQRAGTHVVLACSALRHRYRATLAAAGPTSFVLLDADRETLAQRVRDRRGHFMPASLLASQLATLERSPELVTVDATQPIAAIVDDILRRL